MNDVNSIIRLKGIQKWFGNRCVLKDINLRIQPGELITIMGESGAGKSTLLNILGFFDDQTMGEYFFKDEPVKKAQQKSELRNLYMGFVFQSYNLIPKLTVYENIALPVYYSANRMRNGRNWLDRIPDLLKQFHIEHIAKSNVEHISGGEKQRVCLARALVCDAEVIISDEPTGNLDRDNADAVLNEFINMNRKGKTVIIVTHDKKVETIATKRYHLENGTLLKYEI